MLMAQRLACCRAQRPRRTTAVYRCCLSYTRVQRRGRFFSPAFTVAELGGNVGIFCVQGKRGPVWYYRIKINGKDIRKSLGVRDRASAVAMFADIERAALLERRGYRDPLPPSRTVNDYVEAFADELEAREVGEVYRRDAMRFLRAFAAWCPVSAVRHLRHHHGQQWLLAESKRPRRSRPGQKTRDTRTVSSATVNRSRQVLRSWAKWLVLERVLEVSPFRALRIRHEQSDRRHVRRALSAAELHRLVQAGGPYRGLVYMTAATTGLRRGELRALRVDDLRLSRGYVTIRPQDTKNRKGAQIQLLPDLASALAAYLLRRDEIVSHARAWPRKGNKREAFVFPTLPQSTTFRRDLEEAVVDRETPEGVIDFHALRHTFATLLQRARTPLVVAQRLMRHSDPALTSRVYTHVADRDTMEALTGLASLLDESDGAAVQRPPSPRSSADRALDS